MARNSLDIVRQVDVRWITEPILLALVLGIALAWPLRSPAIEHHGEAREGLVVQAIVDRGEWILPRRNGELPSKPPLFHWLAATAALGLGFSDAVVRLPSAVAAWAVACLTFALGRAIGGRAAGWLAVGALLGMVPFLGAAIEARVDMVFAACTTAALGAFFFWYRDRSPGARALVYAAASAAVLAKGPIGALLPALVIVGFLVAQRELRLVRDLWSGRLLALAAFVDVGWYALAAAVGGREIVELQLVRENWSRLVGNAEFRRTAHGATLRLPGLLVTQYLPWTLVLVWCAVRRVRGVRADAAERFLHVWWLVVLGVFTLAAGKRPIYLLPAAPALALLAGRMLAEATTSAVTSLRASARVGWRVSLARIAVAIAIFDVGTLVTVQLLRESRARRRSLVPFAGKVAEIVPGNQPLPADAAIPGFDRMVLAYRLRRPITHQAAAPGLPYLLPASARLEKWCDGDTLLADSGEAANTFALMRAAAPGTGKRVTEACRGPDPSAGSGGVSKHGPQDLAGSRPRWLLPLTGPSPASAP